MKSGLHKQGARTGKLKPSLRTITIASVRFKKQNDLPENYLQIL